MVFAHPVEASAPPQTSHSLDARIVAYRYLCRRGARKFWRVGLERCDLEQVAAIGLIKAARRYDARTRTPFEAFAWLLIVGELMHHVRDYEHAIRVPRRMRTLERRAARAAESLVGKLGREPSDTELADELGILVPALAALRRAGAAATPLRLDDADAGSLVPQEANRLDERLQVDDALAALAPVERRVIAGIYFAGYTQLELAARWNVAPKRISRLHLRALRRMQAALVP